tara:strand:- start:92 stop:565 length:474 start_codon:yes stop_codon:yes gene_type:complete
MTEPTQHTNVEDSSAEQLGTSETEAGIPENTEQVLWPSPGLKLKKLREELGYSREKVAQSLYITVHYVTALENDDYGKLPGHTFIKGYYKSYATFLKADPEAILNCYLKFIAYTDDQDKQEAEAEESRNRNKTMFWVIAAAVILAVISGAVFWFFVA